MRVFIQDHTVVIDALTLEIWRFIVAFHDDDGSSPTLREISQAVFISHTRITRHLAFLEAWGAISVKPGRARGIKILQRPPEPAAELEPDSKPIP